MRTQEEIIERFKGHKPEDFFGFETSEYFRAMTRDSMESMRGIGIKKDADLSKFESDLASDDLVREHAIDYMEFAWEKANNCRGISAIRSIMHYIAWLWLLGEDGFDDLMDNYEFYGKPQLERVCAFLKLDPMQWDDGKRSNTEY